MTALPVILIFVTGRPGNPCGIQTHGPVRRRPPQTAILLLPMIRLMGIWAGCPGLTTNACRTFRLMTGWENQAPHLMMSMFLLSSVMAVGAVRMPPMTPNTTLRYPAITRWAATPLLQIPAMKDRALHQPGIQQDASARQESNSGPDTAPVIIHGGHTETVHRPAMTAGVVLADHKGGTPTAPPRQAVMA